MNAPAASSARRLISVRGVDPCNGEARERQRVHRHEGMVRRPQAAAEERRREAAPSSRRRPSGRRPWSPARRRARSACTRAGSSPRPRSSERPRGAVPRRRPRPGAARAAGRGGGGGQHASAPHAALKMLMRHATEPNGKTHRPRASRAARRAGSPSGAGCRAPRPPSSARRCRRRRSSGQAPSAYTAKTPAVIAQRRRPGAHDALPYSESAARVERRAHPNG